MTARGFDQHRMRPAIVAAVLLAAISTCCSLAGCSRSPPRSTVNDLNWACGDRRCSVTFRLDNEGTDDEPLAVRVRAYAGSSVQSRHVVGEHTERLTLKSRGAKRYTVGVDTTERAERVNVLLEFDRD